MAPRTLIGNRRNNVPTEPARNGAEVSDPVSPAGLPPELDRRLFHRLYPLFTLFDNFRAVLILASIPRA